MGQPDLSIEWGRLLIEELVRLGCTRVYAAPGSRSAPLTLAAASHKNVTLTMGYDERSLGFCALGWGKAVGGPAAVIVTSGTAAANLLPAVVEASQDHIPLLLLTADRPDHLRHSGANQTIDQLNLFGRFVRWHASLPTPNEGVPRQFVIATAKQAVRRARHPHPGPVHLNIPLARMGGIGSFCHSESARSGSEGRAKNLPNPTPCLGLDSRLRGNDKVGETASQTDENADTTENSAYFLSFPRRRESTAEPTSSDAVSPSDHELQPALDVLRRARNGLVIVAGGYRDDDDGAALDQLLTRLGWPVFAEGPCVARYRAHPRLIPSFDLLLGCSRVATGFCPDVVLQLGTRLVSPPLDRWLQRRAAGEGGDQTARPPYIVAGEHSGTVDPHFAVTHRLPLRGFVPSVLASFCHSHPPCHFDEPPSCHPDERSEEGSPRVSQHGEILRPSFVNTQDRLRMTGGGFPSLLPRLSGQVQRIIDETLATQERLTEPFVARCISRVAAVTNAKPESSANHVLFLGNSMPVRDMGRFAVAPAEKDGPFTVVTANRGASGIDGVLSTACGTAHGADGPVTLVVGDLSLLHDCNGLALLRETSQPITVVVINNRGGGIFALLPFARESGVFDRCFQTRHDHDLGSLCRSFGVPHLAVDRPTEFAQAYAAALQRGTTGVIEARTDVEHDTALRRRIEQAVDRLVERQAEG